MIKKENLDKTNAWPFVEAKKMLRERKNFIEKTHSSSQEIDLYRLTNISREFLNKSHRIDTLDQEKYLKKEKEISIDLENERNTDEDDLYMVVRRTINGATRRYVEYLTSYNYGETIDNALSTFLSISSFESFLTFDGKAKFS